MGNNSTAAEILLFPVWKSETRAMPNVVVRSSLFTARNPKAPRVYRDNEVLAVIGPGEIRYTGKELRQDDEDVLLCLVNQARKLFGNSDLASPENRYRIPFNRGALIAELGWTRNARSYQRLRSCLTRLKATELMVKVGAMDAGHAVSLLSEYAWREDEYWVEIPSLFFRLYGNQYTAVSWEQRQQLPAGLARWLMGYCLSHKTCYPVKIETIAKGAGLRVPTTSAERRKLRQSIRQAAKDLVGAGILLESGVYGDKFIYERMPLTIAIKDDD
jgi:DNA-binding transcriptional LysR family regulator